MRTVLLSFQFFLAIALIASVLLHPAKSDGMAGIGSPAKVFGSQKGAETGLNRITIAIAILWATTSAVLSLPSFLP